MSHPAAVQLGSAAGTGAMCSRGEGVAQPVVGVERRSDGLDHKRPYDQAVNHADRSSGPQAEGETPNRVELLGFELAQHAPGSTTSQAYEKQSERSGSGSGLCGRFVKSKS
jgi:hypothetical protein